MFSGCEGVVEDVVLLGAPVDGTAQAWERMVKVVAGKIVNGYCRWERYPILPWGGEIVVWVMQNMYTANFEFELLSIKNIYMTISKLEKCMKYFHMHAFFIY